MFPDHNPLYIYFLNFISSLSHMFYFLDTYFYKKYSSKTTSTTFRSNHYNYQPFHIKIWNFAKLTTSKISQINFLLLPFKKREFFYISLFHDIKRSKKERILVGYQLIINYLERELILKKIVLTNGILNYLIIIEYKWKIIKESKELFLKTTLRYHTKYILSYLDTIKIYWYGLKIKMQDFLNM